jgi:hypothetical protein
MRLVRLSLWAGVALFAAGAGVLAPACTGTLSPGSLDSGIAVTTTGPGCLGAPNGSCAGYGQGTVCPGPPMVCVACGPGIYTFSDSDCICASGTWSCSAPQPGEVTCSGPEGQYVDPACTVLYPGPQEAGVDAGKDAGADGGGDASVEAASDGSDGASDDAASDANGD